jgi:hypothetical protein
LCTNPCTNLITGSLAIPAQMQGLSSAATRRTVLDDVPTTTDKKVARSVYHLSTESRAR